ncbi:MAG TPA: type III pantothenate kinase [Tepidisphaeraceae bacterium]|nr:type III pantothenate kinase [Tepidisphaeraceae bacterium]
MEINLVVINLGNSRLAVGPFRAGEIGEVVRVPNEDRAGWVEAVRRAWKRIEGTDNAAVVAASVNPRLDEALDRAVMEAANRHVVWVGKDLDLPIKVLTEAPEKTGVDRILNIAAAYEQMGKACVVVDAGTAVTVDVCNDAGEFLGGSISPGASMMFDALNQRTAQLPRVKELAAPSGPFGQSTEQAILHGVYHGIRGMVKEVVETYATEMGSWPDLIATGGDAEVLFKDWELVHAIAPDLTLYGIALAYANHHIKHGT